MYHFFNLKEWNWFDRWNCLSFSRSYFPPSSIHILCIKKYYTWLDKFSIWISSDIIYQESLNIVFTWSGCSDHLFAGHFNSWHGVPVVVTWSNMNYIPVNGLWPNVIIFTYCLPNIDNNLTLFHTGGGFIPSPLPNLKLR